MEAFMKNRTTLLTEKLEGIGRDIFRKSYRKILKKHIGNKPGIYALYKKEKLYYVGKAQELVSRIPHHLKNKHAKCWDRFSVYIAKNKKYVPDLEAVVIAIAGPKGNKQNPLKKATKLKNLIQKDMDKQTQEIIGSTKRGKQAQAKRKSKTKITKASKSQSLRSQNRKSFSLVNLFGIDKPLKATHKKQEYRAMLLTSGKVLYKGKEYNSLGGATKAIGSGASGFVFWQIQDHKNRWVTLSTLREKSRAFKKVA